MANITNARWNLAADRRLKNAMYPVSSLIPDSTRLGLVNVNVPSKYSYYCFKRGHQETRNGDSPSLHRCNTSTPRSEGKWMRGDGSTWQFDHEQTELHGLKVAKGCQSCDCPKHELASWAAWTKRPGAPMLVEAAMLVEENSLRGSRRRASRERRIHQM